MAIRYDKGRMCIDTAEGQVEVFGPDGKLVVTDEQLAANGARRWTPGQVDAEELRELERNIERGEGMLGINGRDITSFLSK